MQEAEQLAEDEYINLKRLLRQRQSDPAAVKQPLPDRLAILFSRFDAATPSGVVDQSDWESLADILTGIEGLSDDKARKLKANFIALYKKYLNVHTANVNKWIAYVTALNFDELADWNEDLCDPFFDAMNFDNDDVLSSDEYFKVYDTFFHSGDFARKVFAEMEQKANRPAGSGLTRFDYTVAGFDFFSNRDSTPNQHIFGPISE